MMMVITTFCLAFGVAAIAIFCGSLAWLGIKFVFNILKSRRR